MRCEMFFRPGDSLDHPSHIPYPSPAKDGFKFEELGFK
jgi:hypothetical protein